MNRKAFPDLVLEVVEGTLHAFVCPTGLSSQELPHAKKKPDFVISMAGMR